MKKNRKVVIIVTIINLIFWSMVTVLHYIEARMDDLTFNGDNYSKIVDTVDSVLMIMWKVLDIAIVISPILYFIFKNRISKRLDLEGGTLSKIVFTTHFIANIVFSYISYYIIQLTCITKESILFAKEFEAKYPERGKFEIVAYNCCSEMRIMNIIVPFTILFIYLLIYNFIYKWKLYEEVVYSDMKWGAVAHRCCLIIYSLLLVLFICAFVNFGYCIMDLS